MSSPDYIFLNETEVNLGTTENEITGFVFQNIGKKILETNPTSVRINKESPNNIFYFTDGGSLPIPLTAEDQVTFDQLTESEEIDELAGDLLTLSSDPKKVINNILWPAISLESFKNAYILGGQKNPLESAKKTFGTRHPTYVTKANYINQIFIPEFLGNIPYKEGNLSDYYKTECEKLGKSFLEEQGYDYDDCLQLVQKIISLIPETERQNAACFGKNEYKKMEAAFLKFIPDQGK